MRFNAQAYLIRQVLYLLALKMSNPAVRFVFASSSCSYVFDSATTCCEGIMNAAKVCVGLLLFFVHLITWLACSDKYVQFSQRSQLEVWR